MRWTLCCLVLVLHSGASGAHLSPCRTFCSCARHSSAQFGLARLRSWMGVKFGHEYDVNRPNMTRRPNDFPTSTRCHGDGKHKQRACFRRARAKSSRPQREREREPPRGKRCVWCSSAHPSGGKLQRSIEITGRGRREGERGRDRWREKEAEIDMQRGRMIERE